MYTYTIDYYEVLGVSHNATKAEIKAAYHRLAMKWHPDMHQGESQRDIENAERMFKLINEAYQSLMNGGPTYAEQTRYEKSDYQEKRDAGSHNDGGDSDSSDSDDSYWNNSQGAENSGSGWQFDWKSYAGDTVSAVMKVFKYIAIVLAVLLGLWLAVMMLMLILHQLLPVIVIGGIAAGGVFLVKYVIL